MGRNVALVLSVAFIGFLAYATIESAINDGISGLLIVSIIVIAILGFGVLGALTAPSDE